MNLIAEILSWGLVLVTLPGTILLALLTVAALWPGRRPGASEPGTVGRIAVVVPAHNEASGISRTVDNLRQECGVGTEIVVVADNCTDTTADIARSHGVRVLERQNPLQRGKGYALDFAFRQLLQEHFDAFIVIDADSTVAPGFVVAMRAALERGADAAQAVYLPLGAPRTPPERFTRLVRVAWNVVRLAGRERLGLSVGILGNGFALTRATLEAVPYGARSIVEDVEYHLDLVCSGRRVRFVPDARVEGEMPVAGAARAIQRSRWEGGRLRVLADRALPALGQIVRGNGRMVEPLAELALLPLAEHLALLAGAALLGSLPQRLYALAALAVVILHVLAALRADHCGWRDILALGFAPYYVVRKVLGVGGVLRAARVGADWNRTTPGFPEMSLAMTTPSPLPRTDAAPVPHAPIRPRPERAARQASPGGIPDVSVVIVSFNTCSVLRECLLRLQSESRGLAVETIVVDNASRDESAAMVRNDFPEVNLICSGENLGFGAANNVGFRAAHGRYVVLLNSDAFLRSRSLLRAVRYMDATPQAALVGARLVGQDGAWQPSARAFPSLVNDFLILSGLAARFPRSRFFGRPDRTWADSLHAGTVDWVPGAFAIVRRDVLAAVGDFDERFFLYYEEVDLCRRIRAAGHEIHYRPEIVVVHLGGESSKTQTQLSMQSAGTQLALWRMRSAFLYYRKNHGALTARAAYAMEAAWHRLRAFKNRGGATAAARAKCVESRQLVQLLHTAWADTRGGRTAPPRPW